ncbi:MAG: hypothetical protein AAF741_18485 [Bacteroidota bacterium]
MDYYLIKGKFRVTKYAPDGDSIMFQANNSKHWSKVVSQYSDLFAEKLEAKNGVVQLRFQGIDALETHYSAGPLPPPKELKGKKSKKAIAPKRPNLHQPKAYGDMATDELLKLFGVTKSTWRRSGLHKYIDKIEYTKGKKTVVHKTRDTDPLEGYVVVSDIERKGRPISWVFPGESDVRDGSRLSGKKLAAMIKKSANYQLAEKGLVYPYFYFTLESILREKLIEAVTKARKKQLNIWSKDKTQEGVFTRSFEDIIDKHVFLPYLFRRLVKHQYKRMMEGYWLALKKKKAYKPKSSSLFLESFYGDTNPYIFLVKEREFKRLNEIVKVTKTKITMKTSPENIVFLS